MKLFVPQDDTADPSRSRPMSEKEAPRRAKLLREMLDPKFEKSSIAKPEPILDILRSDKEDPRRIPSSNDTVLGSNKGCLSNYESELIKVRTQLINENSC